MRSATAGASGRAALAVLALCTFINLVSRGVGDAFAIFLLPIAREFDTARQALTGVFAVFMLAQGLVSPIAGTVFDRLGARLCYSLGLLVFGAAMLLSGSVTALWQLKLLAGVGGAVGAAMIGSVPASSLVSRWFDTRLPTAMAVLSAAMGTGILVFSPISQALVEHFGWRGAYRVYGGLLLGLLLLIQLLPWSRIERGAPGLARTRAAAAQGVPAWTLPRALRSPVFWSLFGVMFFTSVSTFSVSVQLVACLVEAGVPSLQAASIYGTVGMISMVGMLAAGMLAERIGEARFAMISYGCTIVGVGALSLIGQIPSAVAIAAFVLLFGTMQGSRGPLVAVLSARSFAGSRQSGIFGAVLIGMGLGGALGAWASGALYDLTGGYRAGFALSACGAACGMVLFVRVLRAGAGRGHAG